MIIGLPPPPQKKMDRGVGGVFECLEFFKLGSQTSR